jgi:hypothetical protein
VTLRARRPMLASDRCMVMVTVNGRCMHVGGNISAAMSLESLGCPARGVNEKRPTDPPFPGVFNTPKPTHLSQLTRHLCERRVN